MRSLAFVAIAVILYCAFESSSAIDLYKEYPSRKFSQDEKRLERKQDTRSDDTGITRRLKVNQIDGVDMLDERRNKHDSDSRSESQLDRKTRYRESSEYRPRYNKPAYQAAAAAADPVQAPASKSRVTLPTIPEPSDNEETIIQNANGNRNKNSDSAKSGNAAVSQNGNSNAIRREREKLRVRARNGYGY